MNKYQEAVDYLFVKYANSTEEGSFLHRHHIDVIQELVDKETPTKPKYMNRGKCGDFHIKGIRCGRCGVMFGYSDGYTQAVINYCYNCGQRTDWSDEE